MLDQFSSFINEESTIQVLRFLVLLAALVWVLFGGHLLGRAGRRRRSFHDSSDAKDRNRGKDRK